MKVKPKHYGYVFLARPVGWRANWYPELFTEILVRVLGGSKITHCCFGCDDIVLNISFKGTKFHAVDDFIDIYPNLYSIYRIEMDGLPRLNRFEDGVGVKGKMWPTMRRWLLMGRCAPLRSDCLGSVVHCLRAGGFKIDKTTHTMRKLIKTLERSPDVTAIHRRRRSSTEFRVATHIFCLT